MKPPQSHLSFLILAASVTLLVVALYGYMYWQVNVSLSKAITARNLAQTERDHKSRESDLLRLYDSTAAERSELAGYFIGSDATIQFIEAVESIGPQSGSELELSSIEADNLDKAKPGTRGVIRAHVSAQGSWQAVWKTLLFAERLPYKMTINNIQLSTSVLPGTKPQRMWRIGFDVKGDIIVVAAEKPTLMQ